MERIKVLHQVLNPTGIGGVSAEFRALKNSELSGKYDFEAMILNDSRPGINLHDIKFYYKEIKRQVPDIIHIRGTSVDGLNAIIAAKMAHKGKILVTVHGMYSDLVYIDTFKKWICKNIIERLSYTFADGISCVCKYASDRKYFTPFKRKMLPYVYNRMPVFDLESKDLHRKLIRQTYKLRDNTIIGLFVGRMTKEKGLSTLKDAIYLLMPTWPRNLIILFVGDGAYKSELEAACSQYTDKILFVGEKKEVQQYYLASDFFIQPSLHENHSIALLEACAAKIPSIATNCGGNTEIIDNRRTGIIIPINNSNSLKEAILTMYNNDTRHIFTNNLMMHNFQKFSDASCDRQLDSVYMKLLDKQLCWKK